MCLNNLQQKNNFLQDYYFYVVNSSPLIYKVSIIFPHTELNKYLQQFFVNSVIFNNTTYTLGYILQWNNTYLLHLKLVYTLAMEQASGIWMLILLFLALPVVKFCQVSLSVTNSFL